MSRHLNPLESLITSQINEHGPVTFKWFMDKALYHPGMGYYAKGPDIGRRGDFYTNVSVGRIYGDLMAKQFEEMWEALGMPPTFGIVEQGAHHGQFASDVLNWIENFSPDFYQIVKYWIIEPSVALRSKQAATLSSWPKGKVNWIENLNDLDEGSIMGVHFSNELLDAMPVHLVTYLGDTWMENFVDWQKGEFKFVYGPPSNLQLERRLAKLPDLNMQQYQTEVNTNALRWIEDLARVMHRGYVLTVDYGLPRHEYYGPLRPHGTLRCYSGHRLVKDPFQRVGEIDITAHVDWTSLCEVAAENWLDLIGYTDQYHFVIGLGEDELIALEGEFTEATPEITTYIRNFKQLMHPETMGATFKAICFGKNVPPGLPLSGFRYARNPREYLGLH